MKYLNWKTSIILSSVLIVCIAALYLLSLPDLNQSPLATLLKGEPESVSQEIIQPEEEISDPELPSDTAENSEDSPKKDYLHIGYRRIPLDAEEADLSYINLKNLNIDPEEVIGQLKNLKKMVLIGCGFSNEEYAALQDNHPDLKIVWEIKLSHWTIRTDQITFSTSKTTGDSFWMDNTEAYYLKYCTDLEALDLGHNHVTDLSFLQYMPNLKVLILVDNVDYMAADGVHYLSDLSMLQYVPKLKYLEVFANSIKDFSVMLYLPEIEHLNISYNGVDSIEYFLYMDGLKRMWMENTNISYSDYQLLTMRYPMAQIVYFGTGSVDQGWREGIYFEAMRDMFRRNYVNEVYQ